MKLSTKSRYGLRIIIRIARDNLAGRLSRGKEIAKEEGITEPYLEQIMIPLKKSGIIKTQRGCIGGYMLAKSPEDISIMDLIDVLEGEFSLAPCALRGKKCERFDICSSRGVWASLTGKIRKTAGEISIKDILDRKYA